MVLNLSKMEKNCVHNSMNILFHKPIVIAMGAQQRVIFFIPNKNYIALR